jgi:radical SAM superfamily enzyme YgiQ (UPF0313 family)
MRIAFVALSGLRLCRPELLELGLTFPSVARRAREIEALPSLGLLTLAGLTPPDIDVEYLEIRDTGLGAEAGGGWERFDAVAVSTLSATAREAYACCERVRAAGVPVILGGLHATLVPEEAARHADAVVVGEGEPVWPEVVQDLRRGRLRRRYEGGKHGPFDLRQAPMPRFDLLARDRYPRFTVQTSRGCPLACEFCAASMRLTPAYAVKPVEKVIAEIRFLKQRFGNGVFVEFADDNSFVDREHSLALLDALAREQVRWFTESDLRIARDGELLRRMRDAGCAGVLIGLESAERLPLEGVERRSNWKARRFDEAKGAVEKIQRHGIAVNGCFVLGLDGQTPASFGAVAEFVRESGLHDVQITFLTPFPGTPLYRRLSEAGRILVEGAWERCTLFDVNFRPDRMSVDELETNFRALAETLYGEAAVRERRRRFRAHLRERVRERRRPVRPETSSGNGS